jgi:benzoyl-CoA reductase/2-hydroxyglutaryl-CoA dehydratase subunit BcrC/BadD/HgdB
MLKAALGALEPEAASAWVLPTTCDWVVKFREMMDLCGLDPAAPFQWLELPCLKESPRARARWLAEIMGRKDFLGKLSGRKPTRRALSDSLAAFHKARRAFSRLIEARRAGKVPAVWFLLIANSFFLDSLERWTAALEAALPAFKTPARGAGLVFLAGSPIYFPNFKLLHLLEEAGLAVAADDLCSSERLFPAQVAVDDPSEFGLLKALAESYHLGCQCPTFGDNDRRLSSIRGAMEGTEVKGVVFQVLKGCHPYDLESLGLEEPLKRSGLKFIRLETDYTPEDGRNLLNRLEAFSHNLGRG